MWLMFVALPPSHSWPTGSGAGRETGATSIGSTARGWREEARRLTSFVYYLVVAVGYADRNP